MFNKLGVEYSPSGDSVDVVLHMFVIICSSKLAIF